MATVLFTLESYLDKITQLEQQKPVSIRRTIPSHKELAEMAGIHPTNFSRTVNNKNASVNRDLIAITIQELRKRGFSPDFNDLFEYYEDASFDD